MASSHHREPMSWGEVIGLGLLATVVGVLIFSGRSESSDIVPQGTRLPPLMAEGWLNTDRSISRERLAGKVVVVDVWATWCPPCRAAMPELAKLYSKYRPLGVEFLGLTSESEADRPAIEKFIDSVEGFDWPVGYGTLPIQDMLGIQILPTVIVFGPAGGAVWSGHRLVGIEEAIDQALALAKDEG